MGVETCSLHVEGDYVDVVKGNLDACQWEDAELTLRKVNHKVEFSVHLSLTSPGDVQVSPLARASMVPVHILTPEAQETVHAHVQASFTLLKRRHRQSYNLCLPLSILTQHSKLEAIWVS